MTIFNHCFQSVHIFLLTRPLRDVTLIRLYLLDGNTQFLLTRPLRDVTQCVNNFCFYVNISTHTPLAGRDDIIMYYPFAFKNFYSHAPCGT